ncbi:hypothetical protein [Catalinimonas niigatensis]|uniref:hypothetical protein n=1 Tax=Catalinimonas niigatensis TaxID=1397264 RepID=UPI002665D6AB|nr:hypothetical protein [Catalinimonas niigatensis]WPP48916.1 hypothetical protein PZB72_19815 [Catalinimonas niigatensis]
MNKRILIGIAVLIFVWVAITLTLHNQEKQQELIRKIEQHIHHQDSLIHSLASVNDNLERTLSQQDALLNHQKDLIHRYQRAIDSLSVIKQYLERSDLSKRYGTRKRQPGH